MFSVKCMLMKVERKLSLLSSFAEFVSILVEEIFIQFCPFFAILLWIVFCSYVNTKVQEVKS